MECSTDLLVARGSLSATACGWPRGQRAVVDSASTSVHPSSVHIQQHQPWRRRRREKALVATIDCDAGVPHIVHSWGCCLISSATTGPASLHGDDGWL